jgi:hypothetical protein
MDIQNLARAIASNLVIVSRHAFQEADADNLLIDEICLSVVREGRVIENYADDKPYPSCLILSENENNEPIHSVWAYNQDTGWAVLITVYRPDPTRWSDGYTMRRK